MASVWDVPTTSTGVTFPVTPQADVSQLPGGLAAMGIPGGAVMTVEGYGVEGGRPYGTQLQSERADMEQRWQLDRASGAKLSAATRAALGR
jgi:hypothetical protein